MSENMDKELDEIMGLINTDHTKRPVTTKQGQHSAKSTPRYAPSESERLRRVSNRRKQQKIRRWAIIGGGRLYCSCLSLFSSSKDVQAVTC